MNETHFSIPEVPPLLARPMALAPLAPLSLSLNTFARAVARNHPGLFRRLGEHAHATFVLDPTDLPFVILLEPRGGAPRVTVRRSSAQGDARIAGPLAAFLGLVHGAYDGDALFFSRDLVIEGDLTLGLIEQMPLRSKYCQADQFAYRFSHLPEGWRELGAKAYHGAELVYVFKFPTSFVAHFLLGLTALSHDDIGDLTGDGEVAGVNDIFLSLKYGAEDVATEQKVMSMWTNFAKTGDPSIEGLEWCPYTTDNDCFMDIDTTPKMQTGLANAFDSKQ